MSATYAPSPHIAYRIIDDHVFAITPDTKQHELNGEVELLVWRLCEEAPRSKQQLVDAVIETFDVAALTVNSDLETFLNELVSAGVFVKH